jgi:hypothetical protein
MSWRARGHGDGGLKSISASYLRAAAYLANTHGLILYPDMLTCLW